MPGTVDEGEGEEAVRGTSEDFVATFHRVLGDVTAAEGGKPAEISSILHLHELVSRHCLEKPAAADLDLSSRLAEVRNEFGMKSELGRLLQSPHLSALAAVHDNVANRLYEPLLPQIPHEVDEDEGLAVKIVRMVKNEEPLGATIRCQDDGSVFIARVMKGGVADRSGCIQVGDQVLEVNDINVERKTPAEIVKLLNSAKNGTVTFKLIPTAEDSADRSWSEEEAERRGARTFVRALFDYEPRDDALHPCPEAGLRFRTGDVLELLDTADEHWWQGRQATQVEEKEKAGGVGLMPSGRLEERRRLAASATLSTPASKAKQRPRKLMYEARASDEFQADEARAYEEVGLLYPRPGLIRPIVLIGAPGVGRNELKRRLLMLNPDRFVSTVPHTSRPPKGGEVDGVDYHFVPRGEMEARIRSGECLEYGEYRGNLYGTLTESVRELATQGRTPVLNPHPQALRLLRTEEFKPLVVLVAPPPFPALKESRGNARARSTTLERAAGASSAASTNSACSYSRGFSDPELHNMITTSAAMRLNYASSIDYVLVNGSLEFAFRELCDLIQQTDKEPAWVPRTWLR